MRLYFALLPALMLTVSCSGCSDSPTDPVTDSGVVTPVPDAGTPVADTGAPVVEPGHEILGTWRFDPPLAGAGIDGVSFYIDGTVAIYVAVAECQISELGRWAVDGEQLTITMGEQPGQPERYSVSGNRLEITAEGMETSVLTRVEPPCEQAAAPENIENVLTGTWRVEGQGENGHILSQMGRYVRSDNVGECAQAAVGEWAVGGQLLGGQELRILVGQEESIYTVAVQEDGNLELRTPDGRVERWIVAEENCEQRPNEFAIVGTWTPSVQGQPILAMDMQGEVKTISDLASCTVAGTERYALTSTPPELIFISESPEEPAKVHRFRAIDPNSFGITREGLEVVYTRAEQNCHGEDQPRELDYDIIGTWGSADDGAPDFAFSAEGSGMTIQSVNSCAMTEIFSYRLADNPPRLEILRDPEGVPNPNGQPQVDVYEFRSSGPNSFAINRNGVTWRYTKTQANCHNAGGQGGEPIEYPIVGTWEADGDHPGLALNRDEQGYFGQYITNMNGCEAGEGFSYTLSGAPPLLTLLLNRNNELVRVAHTFARIDDNSFTLTSDGAPVTYRRSQTNCHNAGEGNELNYNIIGTWGTQTNTQPTLVFRRDNVGNLGQEISALENCLVQASFSFRLLSDPPMLERLYADDQGQIDERRQPFRVINNDSFTVIINGREITYTRLESDCHTRNDGPPPPSEIEPQQLLGTWQAQGNTGYAFGANNAFKKLSNTNNCAVEMEGSYELAGTLLTLTPGDNQRPLFFSAAMPEENALRLTDDNQQVTRLTRIRRSCF